MEPAMNCGRKLVAQVSNLPTPLQKGTTTMTLSQPLSSPLSDGPGLDQVCDKGFDKGLDEGRDEGSQPSRSPWRSGHSQTAFSLLEVMIACGIFFMAVFAILAMVSAVLRNARSLRRTELDAGMVAAQVTRTNRLTEGTERGDFGNLYQDYSWETETYEVQTNGLWQVDIVVRRRGLQQPVDSMSILVYSPESQSGFGRPTIR
jgi:hypothetical protein